MKYFVMMLGLALALASTACGNGYFSPPNSAGGTWAASLSDNTGLPIGTFNLAIAQSGNNMTVSNTDFSGIPALSACFASGTKMTGQMTSQMGTGGQSNMVTFNMTGSAHGGSVNNTFVMQGILSAGQAAGSFTLTGNTSGCTSMTGMFAMMQTG
jgi:hypothetical protein